MSTFDGVVRVYHLVGGIIEAYILGTTSKFDDVCYIRAFLISCSIFRFLMVFRLSESCSLENKYILFNKRVLGIVSIILGMINLYQYERSDCSNLVPYRLDIMFIYEGICSWVYLGLLLSFTIVINNLRRQGNLGNGYMAILIEVSSLGRICNPYDLISADLISETQVRSPPSFIRTNSAVQVVIELPPAPPPVQISSI